MLRAFISTSLLWVASASLWAGNYHAVSFSSEKLTLSFPSFGKVEKILVAEGQQVNKGEKLVFLDHSELQLQLKRLELEIDDTTAEQAAQLEIEQHSLLLKKLKEAGDAASKTELRLASFKVASAELSLKAHLLQKSKMKAEKNLLLHRISQMTLKSPSRARVEQLYCEVGENVEKLQKVIFLVNIDTLHFDVPLDLDLASKLTLGDRATVVFPDESRAQAKVIYKASLADAASGTRIIRLELKNSHQRPAGEKVQVLFKEKI